MSVGREKVLRFDKQIGEVAASAAGHKNFFTNLIRALQHDHVEPALRSGERGEKPRSAAAKHNHIEMCFAGCFRVLSHADELASRGGFRGA